MNTEINSQWGLGGKYSLAGTDSSLVHPCSVSSFPVPQTSHSSPKPILVSWYISSCLLLNPSLSFLRNIPSPGCWALSYCLLSSPHKPRDCCSAFCLTFTFSLKVSRFFHVGFLSCPVQHMPRLAVPAVGPSLLQTLFLSLCLLLLLSDRVPCESSFLSHLHISFIPSAFRRVSLLLCVIQLSARVRTVNSYSALQVSPWF